MSSSTSHKIQSNPHNIYGIFISASGGTRGSMEILSLHEMNQCTDSYALDYGVAPVVLGSGTEIKDKKLYTSSEMFEYEYCSAKGYIFLGKERWQFCNNSIQKIETGCIANRDHSLVLCADSVSAVALTSDKGLAYDSFSNGVDCFYILDKRQCLQIHSAHSPEDQKNIKDKLIAVIGGKIFSSKI